jgi:hypothetical protein
MVFTELVMMLRVEALSALGQGKRGARQRMDLQAANRFVDMLQILKRRTEGNLTRDEEAFLDATLDEVRRIYGEAINDLTNPASPADRQYPSGFDGEIPGNLA